MPLGLWNLQWLNHNSQRAYPLTEWASKRDQSGSITIPDSFLVSLYLPVHAGLDIEPDKFFLRKLLISPLGYSLVFAYDDGTTDPPLVAATNIAKITHTENLSYAVPGVGDFADTVGHLAIGTLDEIDKLPPGQYIFDPDAGALEPDCVRPLIRGISSISVVNGTERSAPAYGDIELVAGDNLRITMTQSEGGPAQIRFDAISGEGLNEECACDDNEAAPCVRSINGITADGAGIIRLVGNDCVQLGSITNGLDITDSCSRPCCGCDDLDAINRQLDRFGDVLQTAQNLQNRLSGEVAKMGLVVLGSKLNDEGCDQC